MSPELPDLEPESDVDELRLHHYSLATTIAVGGAVVVPVVWLIMFCVTGQRVSLAVANFIGMYAGLCVMFQGWRRDDRRLVRGGTAGTAAVFLVCVGAGPYLSA